MQIGTGVKALTFAALNRFDTLNSVVDRMTGGRINRDTLAHKVLRDALHMGLEMHLGDRSATLVPLVSKLVFDNSAQEISVSIRTLARELVPLDTDYGSGMVASAKRLGAAGAGFGAAGLAELLASTAMETQFSEKLLATMLKQHSFQTLQAYMESSLAGMPFKGFASNLAKNVLQRAVVDQAGLDQSERPVYRLLAGLGNAFLSDGNYQRPLGDYFTQAATAAPLNALEATLLGAGQTAIDVASTTFDTIEILAHGYSDAKNHLASGEYMQGGLQAATAMTRAAINAATGVATTAVPTVARTAATLSGITVRAAVGTVVFTAPTVQAGATSLYQGALSEAGRIYHAAAGLPAYKDASEVYSQAIDQAAQDDKLPALPAPDARTSDSQWVDALVKQQSAVQFAQPDTPLTRAQHADEVDQAFEKGRIDSDRRHALLDLADRFSPEQLAPLGTFSATHQVAHNTVSGNLARLASQSRAGLPLAQHTSLATAQALEPSAPKPADKAGYQLADTYAPHVGKLALDFPEGVYSYADAGRDNLQGAGNLWWGENITLAERAELRKLYNTCSGNEPQMLAVSRYLDPEIAHQALSAPVLSELDPQGTGRLQLRQPEPAGLQLQLADSTPRYRYQLRREGENVQVTVSATWDIAQYGADAQQLRRPQGAQASQLSASVTITVPATGPASHSAPSLQCAIRNEVQFTAHGQLETLATPA
ncbi:hypothetical protein [Pantoea sp. 18069]|uniref:hypothetical protein n=1 Tax=Pantoea sp. 18069 TaxID=2681415 RepID=UPI00135C92C1|nr:hypothetical protein [Pantoea sp. 18069]